MGFLAILANKLHYYYKRYPCASVSINVDKQAWASIIGWTGGQVPPLFEVGGRNVFCPPTFGGNKYLLCVNLLFSCY